MASIAEVIGAVAIVISLIYVGVQVNDSTRAVRSATSNEATAITMSFYVDILSHPERSGNFYDGITDFQSLTPKETFQFLMSMHSGMLAFQNAFYLSQEGTLDPEIQQSMTRTLRSVTDSPGFRHFWEIRRELFRSDFAEYVDDLFAADAGGLGRTFQPAGVE
jgi:hypothetical protein